MAVARGLVPPWQRWFGDGRLAVAVSASVGVELPDADLDPGRPDRRYP